MRALHVVSLLLPVMLASACDSESLGVPGQGGGGDAATTNGEDLANPPSDAGMPPGCAPGLLACAGRCVDPSSDPSNCGACGIVCPPGVGCAGGACKGCRAGELLCGNLCVDP